MNICISILTQAYGQYLFSIFPQFFSCILIFTEKKTLYVTDNMIYLPMWGHGKMKDQKIAHSSTEYDLIQLYSVQLNIQFISP